MATNPSVTLAWDAASGAASYRVHYGTQSGAYTQTTPDVTGTSTTAEGIFPGLTYHFAATSRNGSGVESGYSNQVSYAVPDVAKTTPSVTLAWDAASGAASYRVRYGTQNGVYPSVAPGVTGTSTTVGNLSPGATYYFVATALNANGQEGGYSNQVSHAVPPASTPVPTDPPASPSVTLGWDACTGATAYRVRYGTSSGTYPSVTPATSSTTVTVGGLNPGSTYYFVATAVDASGHESVPSNQVSHAVPAATSVASLFLASNTPRTLVYPTATPYEVGVVFRSARPGKVAAIRFYKGPQNTGTHTAHLWDYSGKLLASATFANETASGWQQVNLSTQVQVAANTNYVAGIHGNQYPSLDAGYFASACTNGPLTAPVNAGVYAYGPSGTFPRDTYQSSNFWVDVVFVG